MIWGVLSVDTDRPEAEIPVFQRLNVGKIELERPDDPELVAGMAGHEVPGVFWNTWRLLNDRQEGVDLGESFEGYEATPTCSDLQSDFPSVISIFQCSNGSNLDFSPSPKES